MTLLKVFSPTVTQSQSLLFMLLKMTGGGVDFPQKTLAFRSFHIDQQTSMVIDAIALRFGMFFPDMLIHQSLMLWWVAHSDVAMKARPSHSLIIHQILVVKRQWKKSGLPIHWFACKGGKGCNLANLFFEDGLSSIAYFQWPTMQKNWFLGNPSLPNRLAHRRGNGPEELSLVCRRRSVFPILREVPSNCVVHLLP